MSKINRRITSVIGTLLLITNFSFAQLSAPQVKNIFGGRINAIKGYAKTADTSRIFIATESANSIFYADVYANTPSPTFGDFHVMPGVDANAGYGANIYYMAVNPNSGSIFFVSNSRLLSSNPSSATVINIYNADINGLLIEGNYIFFTESGRFHFGTVDASDNFSENSSSPLALSGIGRQNSITIDPLTNYMYIFSGDISPILLKINSTYTTISGSSTVTDISPTTLTSTVSWTAFNISPDGTFYLIGHAGQDKYYAYSTNSGATWTDQFIGNSGMTWNNIDFAGNAFSYVIYCSNIFNDNNGASTDWHLFGESGFDTHPNDGAVLTDPINDRIVYMTTDQGIGASTDQGYTIFEIDNGIEAVQVNDFSMTPSKTRAWIAAKSGIRRVDNYLTSPTWTNALFPTGDGSPYHSIEMGHADSNIVYAGNLRIYKSTDNGSMWTKVFTPEDPPYNFPSIEIFANAIEECKWNTNIVMAGFEMQDSLHKGGLFVSEDAGNTWQQILIKASTIGEDVDVTDIVFNLESPDTVAYVSVKYELASPQGYSIYRLVKNGSTWIPSQDMNSSNTSTGSVIVASLSDIQLSVTGDTIFTAGTDAGNNHPTVYYKDLNGSGLWTPFDPTGFPFGNTESPAVTIGKDTLYAAVDNEVYYYDLKAGTSWQLGYTYPVGTKINFLYYDDLLVGTSIGLYGQKGLGTTEVNATDNVVVKGFELSQNYPNPFNPTTVIKYSIPASAVIPNPRRGGESQGISSPPSQGRNDITNVSLKVYDILGREVAVLVNEKQAPGNYSVQFNAIKLSSGIYFYRLSSGDFTNVKKMILMK